LDGSEPFETAIYELDYSSFGSGNNATTLVNLSSEERILQEIQLSQLERGQAPIREVQQVWTNLDAGSIALKVNNQTTASFDVAAARINRDVVKDALLGLAGIDFVEVEAGEGTAKDPWVVRFTQPFSGIDLQAAEVGTNARAKTPLLVQAANSNSVKDISHQATGGTFRISLNTGLSTEKTGAIEWRAEASQVEAALEALSGIDNVTVTKTITPADADPNATHGWRIFFHDAFSGGKTYSNIQLANSESSGFFGRQTTVTLTQAADGEVAYDPAPADGATLIVRADTTTTAELTGQVVLNLKPSLGLNRPDQGVSVAGKLGDVRAALKHAVETLLGTTGNASTVTVTGEGTVTSPFKIGFDEATLGTTTVRQADLTVGTSLVRKRAAVSALDTAADIKVTQVFHDAFAGTFALATENDNTDPLPHDISAASLQAKIQAQLLSGSNNSVSVVGTGTRQDPWVITETKPVNNPSGFKAFRVGAGEPLRTATAPTLTRTGDGQGELRFSDAVAGGFKLKYQNQESSEIGFDATADALRTALQPIIGLPAIADIQVRTTGVAGKYSLTLVAANQGTTLDFGDLSVTAAESLRKDLVPQAQRPSTSVAQISLGTQPAEGSFSLSFSGSTSPSIRIDTGNSPTNSTDLNDLRVAVGDAGSAAVLQAALRSLNGLDSTSVNVGGSGTQADPWEVTLSGSAAGKATQLDVAPGTLVNGGGSGVKVVTKQITKGRTVDLLDLRLPQYALLVVAEAEASTQDKTLVLKYGDKSTGAIDLRAALNGDAGARLIENELKALPNVQPDSVSVTRSNSGIAAPWIITLVDREFDLPALTIDLDQTDITPLIYEAGYVDGVGGGVAVATLGDLKVSGLNAGDQFFAPNAPGGRNEVQLVSHQATRGKFLLSFRGDETTELAHNAGAQTIQNALVALPNIEANDVLVTALTGSNRPQGATNAWTVEFRGNLAGLDQDKLGIASVTGTDALKTATNSLDTRERVRTQREGGLNFTYLGVNGSDLLVGGAHRDNLQGGDDDDLLVGGDNEDVLAGGKGRDILSGGEFDDELQGGAGEDLLLGGAGDDRLDAGVGNDQLLGGAGNDRLIAGVGDDLLVGGAANDVLDGGIGDDRYVFADGWGHDVLVESSKELGTIRQDIEDDLDARHSGNQDTVDFSAVTKDLVHIISGGVLVSGQPVAAGIDLELQQERLSGVRPSTGEVNLNSLGFIPGQFQSGTARPPADPQAPPGPRPAEGVDAREARAAVVLADHEFFGAYKSRLDESGRKVSGTDRFRDTEIQLLVDPGSGEIKVYALELTGAQLGKAENRRGPGNMVLADKWVALAAHLQTAVDNTAGLKDVLEVSVDNKKLKLTLNPRADTEGAPYLQVLAPKSSFQHSLVIGRDVDDSSIFQRMEVLATGQGDNTFLFGDDWGQFNNPVPGISKLPESVQTFLGLDLITGFKNAPGKNRDLRIDTSAQIDAGSRLVLDFRAVSQELEFKFSTDPGSDKTSLEVKRYEAGETPAGVLPFFSGQRFNKLVIDNVNENTVIYGGRNENFIRPDPGAVFNGLFIGGTGLKPIQDTTLWELPSLVDDVVTGLVPTLTVQNTLDYSRFNVFRSELAALGGLGDGLSALNAFNPLPVYATRVWSIRTTRTTPTLGSKSASVTSRPRPDS
jgi:Ca2+-binding RTX toxin-like protein